MSNHWAIAIGVNQYLQMEPLSYAGQDAAAVHDLLLQSSAVEQIYYFSDDSAAVTLDGVEIATQPTLSNLKHFLQVRFAAPFLNPEDTLWFFFSGHGLQYANRDYLMPSDADPENAAETAIAIEDLVGCLRRSGTDNIVLMLDACRTDQQKFGQGFGADPENVVALFATNYNQASQAIPQVQQGAFTYALVEGIQLLGRYKNPNLEHLYLYLRDRLPKLNVQYLQPTQTPRLRNEPARSLETIAIPRVVAGNKGFFDLLFLRQKVGAAAMGTVALSPDSQPSILKITSSLGLMSIVAVVIGYVVSQETGWFSRKPTASNAAEQTQRVPANGSKTNAQVVRTNPPQSPIDSPKVVDLGGQTQPIQRVPRPGIYYASNPLLSSSRREIGISGTRLCIKIVNGDANPGAARSQVIVSSISSRPDGLHVDATREKIKLGDTYTEFTDQKSVWQRLEKDVDESGAMGDCLLAKTAFARQQQEE